MAQRSSSMGSRHRLSRMLFQNPITGTDREIAVTHETNRQSTVKQVLLHVFFLSKFRLITGMVAVEKAESQYLGGHGVNEAAHCAPGQILAGGRAIQRLITRSNELELEVENLFGNTDDLHARFNIADSRAEENGLRQAFGNACNAAAQAGRTARFNRAQEFVQHIDNAFSLYKTQGVAAYNTAIAAQRAKLAQGKPLAGTTRQEVIFILETYRSTLMSAMNSLDTVQGLFPEDLWREYRALV